MSDILPNTVGEINSTLCDKYSGFKSFSVQGKEASDFGEPYAFK